MSINTLVLHSAQQNTIRVAQQIVKRQQKDRDSITIELNKREAEVLNTLLSTEIMKLDLHYGTQKHTERQNTCYAIRNKLVKAKEEKHE